MNYKDYIDNVQDYPHKGILFRDIQPLLSNYEIFSSAISDIMKLIDIDNADYLIGIESRGFIFSSSMALKSGLGNKMIRKKGKLPNKQIVYLSYNTEYSSDTIEMKHGSGKVIIVDDVYATGGTMKASIQLAIKAGFEVIDTICLIDIGLMKKHKTKCLIYY